MGDDLHDCFHGEDDHESVVEYLENVLELLALHVPDEAQHECVAHDTDHDEGVEGPTVGGTDEEITECTVVSLQSLLRLLNGAHLVYAREGKLRAPEHTIPLHDLLLIVEGLCDHTDEELDEEHADDDDEDHGVDDHENVVILLRLVVGTNSVNRVPHDVDPTFGRLDRHKCQQTVEGCVEVEVRCGPHTAVINAIPLRLDILDSLSHV